jgi:hypothetical protein
MSAEYSYFRVRPHGESYEAIRTVQNARRESAEMLQALCEAYGAKSVFGHITDGRDKSEPAGRYIITDIVFDDEAKIPAGWKISQHATPSNRIAVAMPPRGSEDDFHLRQTAIMINDCARERTLEGVFGIADMPMRALPAGDYHSSFVVYAKHKETAKRTGKEPGYLSDMATMLFGSNSACKVCDPLDYKYLDGDWYIRVPNDGQGRPHFTPPDSDLVGYEKMMDLDARETFRPTYTGHYYR